MTPTARHHVALLVVCLLLPVARRVAADVLTVGLTDAQAFGSIMSAWEAAEPGDTILVTEGVYHEEIIISEGEGGTPDSPITIAADPSAPAGSVILNGAREVASALWTRFASEAFGVVEDHNMWSAEHDPEQDADGWELAIAAWPYELHPGGHAFSIGSHRLVRYGTSHLLADGQELALVPSRPDAGAMADKVHADSEETQSHEYITASSAKFLKESEWIWYDGGHTDGADEDLAPVEHPPELANRIFVRLPVNAEPSSLPLSISIKSSLLRIGGARHIVVDGLTLVRADHTAVQVSRSEGIVLRGLTVRGFGGGRKFYPSPEIQQHLYGYGGAITVNRSDCVITDCVIEDGTGKGISAWGDGPESPNRLTITNNVIRDIRPHRWGGGWAHGRGSGIGTGNASNVRVEGNRVSDVANCGLWVDGGGGDSELHIFGNQFDDCGNWGIFLELGIVDALVAYNHVERSKGGFRVGPGCTNARIIGNVFDACELGGALYVWESRVGRRTDTVTGFALAGNQLLNCARQALAIEPDLALMNERLFFDGNVYHLSATAEPAYRAFASHRGYVSFDDHRRTLVDSGNCLAAEGDSEFLSGEAPTRTPVVSSSVLDALEGFALLSARERALLDYKMATE
ncbi:hypothetical protein HN371_30225 [Candidatus Poribacteria bacterium]|jgi:hypothetical protein|nr:hypothetical protein [Candidatus Poribacteria bacterium]MBT5532011.1 hypothetical protein [Candidatus Poribacteria bacterium]MBT5711727.1 hypothetical protein [Candidatus Poribacteria bacterium]MBT7804949.1 hypothetical protein [Candidatus Poribacteria bacterium]